MPLQFYVKLQLPSIKDHPLYALGSVNLLNSQADQKKTEKVMKQQIKQQLAVFK